MKKPRAIVVRFELDPKQKKLLRKEARERRMRGLREILREYGMSLLC